MRAGWFEQVILVKHECLRNKDSNIFLKPADLSFFICLFKRLNKSPIWSWWKYSGNDLQELLGHFTSSSSVSGFLFRFHPLCLSKPFSVFFSGPTRMYINCDRSGIPGSDVLINIVNSSVNFWGSPFCSGKSFTIAHISPLGYGIKVVWGINLRASLFSLGFSIGWILNGNWTVRCLEWKGRSNNELRASGLLRKEK